MQNILTKFADGSGTVKPVDPTCTGADCKGTAASDTLVGNVTAVLNAVIGILGLVCVVVMIIGGINYMTSAGDAGKVKKGKDTILYGLIGLVVCVLAFALVNWVIKSVIPS